MRFPGVLAAALLVSVAACSSAATDASSNSEPSPVEESVSTASNEPEESPGPVQLVPEILSTRPHDPSAWTQGLILHGDRIFESTGAEGAPSTLREVDGLTGEIVRQLIIDEPLYAEGLERVDDRLVQLTWRDGLAFVYDLETFDRQQAIPYQGEGWGLCRDGDRLVMSNGSELLQFRDPETFGEIAPRVAVTLDGEPVLNLNELECVDGTVWANVWLTDIIVGIDPATGAVTAVVDGSGLDRPDSADSLNGIAYDPATGHFLLTGKRWPTTYEVRFVPAG